MIDARIAVSTGNPPGLVPWSTATLLAVVAAAVLVAGLVTWRRYRAAKRDLHLCVQQLHEAQRALGMFQRPGTPPAGVPGLGHSDIHEVLTQVEDVLPGMLGSDVSLDVLNACKGNSSFAAERLERVLVYLALLVRQSTPGGGTVTVRAYDGLGNVARGDGRRTWTIIEVGKVVLPAVQAPTPRATAAVVTDAGFPLVQHVVRDAGGRLDIEERGQLGPQFILQLPSIAA